MDYHIAHDKTIYPHGFYVRSHGKWIKDGPRLKDFETYADAVEETKGDTFVLETWTVG